MTAVREGSSSARRELYLIWPRCRRRLNPRVSWLAIEYCPRCLGRHKTEVPMVASPPRPAELSHEHSPPGRQPDPERRR